MSAACAADRRSLTHTHPEQTADGGARSREAAERGRRATLVADRRGGSTSTATPADGLEPRRRASRRPRPLPRARRRRHDPAGPAPLRRHRRARLRDQLRHDRLPRGGRARGARRGPRARLRRRLRRDRAARPRDRRSRSSARSALNDVSFIRRPHGRVAELSYRLGGEEIGHVRCDGLVAATPAGSTGYNLANPGPILAWGVEGFVVSFIAPHTLTARAAGGRARRRPPRLQRARPRAGRDRLRRRTPSASSPAATRSRSASATASRASPSSRARTSTAVCARSSAAWPRRPATPARDGANPSAPVATTGACCTSCESRTCS